MKEVAFPRRGVLIVLVALLMIAVARPFSSASAKLYVVTTTPDLAAICREIGGDGVEAESLALATQDPHFVDAKPSFILRLNRAKLYVKRGLDLEVGWAPVLERGARNSEILQGGRRYVDASEGIAPLQIPAAAVSRSLGDVHPFGNPHYQRDPLAAKTIARNIAAGLVRIDPANRARYEERVADFNRRIDERLEEWTKELAPYRGAKIVTYHKNWEYFTARFGLDVIGEMEPKPGVAPSPAHLADLIRSMIAERAKVIIREPFYPDNLTRIVAAKTGAKVLMLPESPGGVAGTDDYFSFMEYTVKQIAGALEEAKGS